ncbi:MAG: ester cyclase, partial [Pseudomonadota bacterium]
LRRIWSKSDPEVDPVFAYHPPGTIEDLVDHWPRKVSIAYDSGSGLIDLRVLAFDPQEARAIAQLIFKQFRDGLSENTRHLDEGVFFGDRDFVAFSGWPSGTAVHSGDGFLGLAPTGRRITRRSLDFWRIEDELVRECWVMVDMLDLYRQLGIDVFARSEMQRAGDGAPGNG